MGGVGVEGTPVEGFGPVMVAAHVGEEVRVVAEDARIGGVGVDGTLVQFVCLRGQ